MKNNKGFTLVELLVVIAIIAVLSAIAIVNLNSARTKGNDASIKANLAALPAGAEVYYDDQSPNSYLGFCSDAAIDGVAANVTSSKGNDGFFCQDTATDWKAYGRLETDWWCIDSTGVQGATTATSTGVGCKL